MTKSIYYRYSMTDKAEMVYKILLRYKNGTTASHISKLMKCDNSTTLRYLNWFFYHGIIEMFKIGRYKVFKTKEENKNKNVKLIIENALEKERKESEVLL